MMPQGSTFTTRPQLAGTFGMVASTHWLASAAGMAVLEQGGNAFDAAVAAGLVLQVVEPHLNGPGGEVPVIGYDAGQGEVFVLDGQGRRRWPPRRRRSARSGWIWCRAAGCSRRASRPPSATWMLLLAAHGRLPLREVMEYAIGYARDGYPVVPGSARASRRWLARSASTGPPRPRSTWRRGARAGSRLANPVLAATYQRHPGRGGGGRAGRDAQIEAARRAFYQGFVAEAIGALPGARRGDGRHRGASPGLLTADDLAGWRARTEQPVTCDYGGLTVCKTGPWGQGPVFLQQLALLAGFDLAAMGRAAPTTSTPWWSAPSSRSPTGRPGTAIPGSPTSRWPTCCRRLRGAAPRAGRPGGVAGSAPGQRRAAAAPAARLRDRRARCRRWTGSR